MDKPETFVYPDTEKTTDRLAGYQRSAGITHLPFFAVVAGGRGSGKTKFIRSWLSGQLKDIKFEWDRIQYFRDKKEEDDFFETKPYSEMNKPQGQKGVHSVVVYDDPPQDNAEFMKTMDLLARTARHDDISVILTLHSFQNLNASKNQYLKANSDYVVVPSSVAANHKKDIARQGLYHRDQISELDTSLRDLNYNFIQTRNKHLIRIQRPNAGGHKRPLPQQEPMNSRQAAKRVNNGGRYRENPPERETQPQML